MGPAICPNSKAISPPHSACGRVLRTKLVVDATTEKKALPKRAADARSMGQVVDKRGSVAPIVVAAPMMANAPPPSALRMVDAHISGLKIAATPLVIQKVACWPETFREGGR